MGNTYHARIHLLAAKGGKGGEVSEVDIDARPSGAAGRVRGEQYCCALLR